MISPRADVIGLPPLRLSSQASSSLFFLMRSASFESVRPRLPAAQFAQPLRSAKAFSAAATALGPRHRADRLTGGRVDDVEGLAVGGVDGLAADHHAGRAGGVRAGRRA